MSQKQSDTLHALVGRCRDGDEEAMEMIYLRYRTALFNLAYRFSYSRLDAEDLLQDIFIKVLSNIGQLRNTSAFKTWLFRIAVNTCINSRSKRCNTISFEEFKESDHNPGTADNPIQQSVEQAVRTLPPKQRSVFLLHDVQGMTHDEIAKIMRCSNGTSKSQLFNARMKIRQYLKRE